MLRLYVCCLSCLVLDMIVTYTAKVAALFWHCTHTPIIISWSLSSLKLVARGLCKCSVGSVFVQPREAVEWTLWRHNVECSNFQPDIPTNSVISHLNAQKHWLQWFLISSAWMGGQNDVISTRFLTIFKMCVLFRHCWSTSMPPYQMPL
jgi:hypothetical protein